MLLKLTFVEYPPPLSRVGYVETYPQTSNKRRTSVGNKTVEHPDVVGASPVGAAPIISSFSI